jgi:hypothetical protein
MLHTPIYDVRGMPYCGPTAIAAVTGEPISIIRDIIREQVGTKKNGHAKPNIGVSREVLLKTMHMLGWHVIKTGGKISQARQRIIERHRVRHHDENDDVITPTTRDIIRFGDFLDFM